MRQVAHDALAQYPKKFNEMEFIFHGENTTFCVTDSRGGRYLLRLHRNDYHTDAAIFDELDFMERVATQTTILIPMVTVDRAGQRLVTGFSSDGFSRRACLFRWVDGRFNRRSFSSRLMHNLGDTIGDLHRVGASFDSKHRRYWDASGLLGPNAKFGVTSSITGATPMQQESINAAHKKLSAILSDYQTNHSTTGIGYIHADLHYGNILRTKSGLGVIDFDDSGIGFYAYDLAIPISALPHRTTAEAERANGLRQELTAAYSKKMPWSHADDYFLDACLATRQLVMLGWLVSRADNPKLADHLSKNLSTMVVSLNRLVSRL